VRLTGYYFDQMSVQRRAKVQVREMQQFRSQSTKTSHGLDVNDFWNLGFEYSPDTMSHCHLGHRTAPAGTLKRHLHDAIDHIYQLYIAAIALQRRAHFIQHLGDSSLEITVALNF